MAKEKKTRYVILGILIDHPHTGYEILGMIKKSTNYFWRESDASIYPTLKMLFEEGLVTKESAYVGMRAKERYSITEKGREEFKRWFKQKTERDFHRQELLLKMFFTTSENEDEMQEHLKVRLKELKESLKEYKKMEAFLEEEFPDKLYWMKTLQNGIAHVELDIDWIRRSLK